MKSFCYVILPDNLSLEYEVVYSFVKNHILQYYYDLDVTPYKRFFSERETAEIAKRKGFSSLLDFETYLQTYSNDEGIENGLYYQLTTYNTKGMWDYFSLESVKKGSELSTDGVPHSLVTLDGIWHSEHDFGYSPILDFEIGKQHQDNIEPEKQWIKFVSSIFNKYEANNFAVLYIHS